MSVLEPKFENTYETIYQNQTIRVRDDKRSQASDGDYEGHSQFLVSQLVTTKVAMESSVIHESAAASGASGALQLCVGEENVVVREGNDMALTGEDSQYFKAKTDEILKELRIVKRQNLVTNCLVGTMIVLTLGWQLSEVSLILMLKEGLTHPFRSFGSMLLGMIRKRSAKEGQDTLEKDLLTLPVEPPPPIPRFKLLELPNPFNMLQGRPSSNGK